MRGDQRRRRLARVVGAIGLAVALASHGGEAAAQARPESFSIAFQEGPVEVSDTCAGEGVVGILTGAGTMAGQIVDADTTAHHLVTITFVYRVDFPDGSYLLAAQRERIVLNEILLADGSAFGGTLLERGTLYDEEGGIIGHEMFHHRFRITVVHGVPVVDFDEGFLSCR